MDNKKYYWIKLKTEFFNQDTIDFLLSQSNGCEYVVLYQMLCLKTANNNGLLSTNVGEIIVPYDISKIARDTKYFSEDTIRVALELYKQLGLIYEGDNSILQIAGFEAMIGSESASREATKKREYRLRKRIEDKEGDKVGTNCPTDIDIDIDIEKDIDIDIYNKKENIKEKKNKYGFYKHVLLTPTEYNKLEEEYPNYEELITFLDEYIEMKGYKARNHYLCIKKWVVEAVKERTQKKKQTKDFDRPAWLDMDL